MSHLAISCDHNCTDSSSAVKMRKIFEVSRIVHRDALDVYLHPNTARIVCKVTFSMSDIFFHAAYLL